VANKNNNRKHKCERAHLNKKESKRKHTPLSRE